MAADPHRDRRGRGPRRGLPAAVRVAGRRVALPARRSPRQVFHQLVQDALRPLVGRWAQELDGLQLVVQEVPPEPEPAHDGVVADATAGGSVSLAHVHVGPPPQLVVYRKPVELRADDDADLAELVRDVVVEAVAELLGKEPDEVDPDTW